MEVSLQIDSCISKTIKPETYRYCGPQSVHTGQSLRSEVPMPPYDRQFHFFQKSRQTQFCGPIQSVDQNVEDAVSESREGSPSEELQPTDPSRHNLLQRERQVNQDTVAEIG